MMEPPKWLDDAGKDAFNDVEAEENIYGEIACEAREKLLKLMVGKGTGMEAIEHRAKVLMCLGMCAFKQGDYARSKMRFESAMSEMNMPTDDIAMQDPGTAIIVLMKQGTGFLSKFEVSQGATALRRCREILDRNIKKIIKIVHKQMPKDSPPVEKIIEEVPGYGKTGQILPVIAKQVPMLKMDLPWAELLDITLDQLDSRLAGVDKAIKDKRTRLGVSKSSSKAGSTLMYVPALTMEPVVPAKRFAAAEDLASNVAKALQEEAASIEKSLTLLKRSKGGSGCKEDKGLEKTCAALQKVADVQSNVFGETRLVVAKSGKKQALEACSTNANVAILLAAKDGAKATVAGAAEPVELKAGEPVVIDFCREASIEADATTPVLFAQAWHPEFAGVERTTEIRARSKAFGLSEDEVKAVTKVVNDHAKKHWEQSGKQWRTDSEGLAAFKEALSSEKDAKKKAADEAAEAKRQEDDANDEEKKKALEELEKKREAKKKAAQDAEEARAKRKKQLEEERENRDPWLKSPDVKAAEALVEDLKEQRREANAKLEFDLSTQLTKDISAAERALKKAIKKAKKAYKKGGAAAVEASAEKTKEEEKPKEEKGGGELKSLKKQLSKVKEQKAEASKNENFKDAKRLKKEEKDLEEKIAKLEL